MGYGYTGIGKNLSLSTNCMAGNWIRKFMNFLTWTF